MANDLNQCNFIGRLGKDPETMFMPSGGAVTNFSIAVGSQWKDKNSGDKQEKTEWINITAFGKLGEICGKYLTKGSQVYISGRFTTDKYQDKDDKTCYSTKIIADRMQMLGGKPSSSGDQSRPASSAPAQDASAGDDFDSDIPF